jgi:hypothetical protein
LDFFIVFLCDYFAKLMEKDVLGLSYAVSLLTGKLANGHTTVPLLGQVEQ